MGFERMERHDGKPRFVRGFLFSVAIAILVAGCGGPKSDLVTLKGEAQGSTFTIKYIDTLQRDLSGPVDSLFRVIDRSLSLWDTTSTVTAFNAAADTFVSDDVHFRTVVALSRQLWHSTDSAFDPTVLPLVKAWGLGKKGRAELDTNAVTALRRVVGMDRIAMDESWRQRAVQPPVITYFKREQAVQFDPNGIAQGYTVDVLAMLLQQHGITNYMVEVGGEVRCAGANDKGTTWVMQIDKPVEGDAHQQQTTVPLQDRSLATSGNYRKFIELGGKRYGHTIDPRSGRPAMNTLLSASVIADDAATADALGTALMVMGPEEAKSWLGEHREVEAYLIIDDGNSGYSVWITPGWPAVRR
jgi:thiamine biosynthesis lipoprotein